MPNALSAQPLEPRLRPTAARRIIDVQPQDFRFADAAGRILTAHAAAAVIICLHDPFRRAGTLGMLLLAGRDTDRHRASREEQERAGAGVECMISRLAPTPEQRRRLEAHVFGGASLLMENADPYLGARSASFVLRLLDREAIPVRSTDLGGCFPRSVRFEPATAAIGTEFLSLRHGPALCERERESIVRRAESHSAG